MDAIKDGSGGMEAPEGCWHLKGIGLDAYFIGTSLTDTALQASQWADRKFQDFPAWAVYRLFAAQDPIHYERVTAYAISMAVGLARSRKESRNSHPLVARRKRGMWLVQAAMDAVYFGIHMRYPVGGDVRGEALGVHPDLYRKIRDAVAGGMLEGFEAYRAELFCQYRRAKHLERLELNGGEG